MNTTRKSRGQRLRLCVSLQVGNGCSFHQWLLIARLISLSPKPSYDKSTKYNYSGCHVYDPVRKRAEQIWS